LLLHRTHEANLAEHTAAVSRYTVHTSVRQTDRQTDRQTYTVHTSVTHRQTYTVHTSVTDRQTDRRTQYTPV